MNQAQIGYRTLTSSYDDTYTADSRVSGSESAVFSTSDDSYWRDAALRRMGELSRLGDNWDGLRSPRVPKATMQFAFTMLCSIMPPRAPAPTIVPLSDGGLLLSWSSSRGELEVEVEKPNHVMIAHFDHTLGSETEWRTATDLTRLNDILWGLFKDQ